MKTNNQKNIQLIKNNKLEELINANKLFCLKMAKQYTKDEYYQEELLQEAKIGLYEAALLFDETINANFLTYAAIHIKKRLYQYTFDMKPTIRIPMNHVHNVRKMKKKMDADEYYNLEDDDEFSKKDKEVLNAPFNVISGDIENEDGTSTIMDTVSSVDDIDIEDVFKSKVKELLSYLKKQDQDFIKLYYGIDNEERDKKSLAKHLGVTRQAISIRKIRILKLLQKVSLS